jgi:hypothetical protein
VKQLCIESEHFKAGNANVHQQAWHLWLTVTGLHLPQHATVPNMVQSAAAVRFSYPMSQQQLLHPQLRQKRRTILRQMRHVMTPAAVNEACCLIKPPTVRFAHHPSAEHQAESVDAELQA